MEQNERIDSGAGEPVLACKRRKHLRRGRKHGRGAFRGACGLDCGRIDPDAAL